MKNINYNVILNENNNIKVSADYNKVNQPKKINFLEK